MLNKCWQQSDWINHLSMRMSFLPVFFDKMFLAEWDISKEYLYSVSSPSALSLWPIYITRWSFLYKRFTGVPTVCQMVFTTPGSLKSHSKIHTGATSCSRCSRRLATVGSLKRHMKSEHRNAYDTIWAPVLEIKDRGDHQDILGGPKSWRPKKGRKQCPNPTCYMIFFDTRPNSVLKIIG